MTVEDAARPVHISTMTNSAKREERKDQANLRSEFAVTMRLLRLNRLAAEERNRPYAGWSAADFAPEHRAAETDPSNG